ncbi:MAG: hypothetical protein K6E78_06340 [Treponema sp.]|nr:hypothetical protein [Treponema sp.]
MKKITVPVLNALLAAGVALILSGLILILRFSAGWDNVPVLSVLAMIFGALVFYAAMTIIHWAVLFFSGLLLFCLGICMTFAFSGLLPLGPEHLWPIGVILCGICLILTCIFKHQKIRMVYLFPSLLILTLGFIFLLFSLEVIKISFSSFMSKWSPSVLIFIGASLIAVFLWQRNFKEFFPYDKDELSDLTDEEKEFYGD